MCVTNYFGNGCHGFGNDPQVNISCRSSMGALVVQIRDMMQLEFCSYVISVCNRSCNNVADSLATHGAYVLEAGFCVYMSKVPWYVMDREKSSLHP